MNRLSYPKSKLLTGLVLGVLAAHCSSPTEPTLPGSTGGTATSTGGSTASGGSTTIGGNASATGGVVATGGVANGTGGSATGGTATGGTATGGAATGTGGSATGGAATGGSGGKATGGAATGGSGGKATGGSGGTSATGGSKATGGAGGSVGNFSFFVTSFVAIKRLSGNPEGFGGDLRYGQADGLAGADKICTEIAETAMAGAGTKTWRAFLSVKGPPVINAIDRVGNGPWYDRKGRLLAMTKTALAMTRPQGADPAIINDFPNEDGVPNHNPDGTGNVDNHDMLTGATATGTLDMGNGATCTDWTSKEGVAGQRPRVGHSWPAQSGMNWMSALYEGGCAPGVNLIEMGPPQQGVYTVGTGGGYGGFYCFALTP